MLIGELSRKSELSRDTIRYYEKRGLIKAGPSVSEFNNYKEYSDTVLQRLLLIKQSKAFGFSLKEIGELLDLMDMDQANCQVLEERVKAKLLDIEQQIQNLHQMRKRILLKATRAKLNCHPLAIRHNCPTFTAFGKSN